MFSRSTLQYATRQTLRYRTKLRHRFRTPTVLPIKQTMKQREETIKDILKQRQINPGNHKVYQYVEQRLYSRGSRLDREGLNLNKVYALQGLGDLEPLRSSQNFGFSEKEALKYNSPSEAAKYEAPPIPYTPLAARKLAEGKLWPPAPEPTGMLSCEVRLLRDRSNMSPSAQRFADKIAYHLRRSLKACPAHIGERIDFSQLMIQEVVASRRSREIYIVWSTVDPGARFEIEPCLHRLNNWVQRLIMQRIKTRPNIPHVHWIFDGGRLERELPRDLRNELNNLVGETTTSLQTRVQYLKELDTINQRMKGIPWFMPYLWNKEEKAEKTRTMRKDLEEYRKRRADVKAAQSEREKATQSRRSVAPQTAPPPSYIR